MRSFCSLIIVSAILFLSAGGQCYGAMAIEFDNSSSSGDSSGGNTISWLHQVGSGDYRILVVGVAAEEDHVPDVEISSVTYGGVPLTEVAGASESVASPTTMKTDLYYLLSPAVGTATVEITYVGNVGFKVGGAVSLFNVRQEGAEAVATNSAIDDPDTTSTEITTVSDGAWVVDVIGSGATTSFNPTGGMTEMWDLGCGVTMQCAGSRKAVATAGATTISWSHTSANRIAHSVAAFGPADSDSDMDDDGRVDEVDLGMMAAGWLGGSGLADLDGSGDVEFGDYVILAADWYMGYGSLQVTIGPAEAVSLGAKWRLAGGGWQDSGAIVSGLPVGQYTVEFSGGIAGYNPPANKQVQIVSRQLTAATGTYTPYSGSVQVTIEPAGARTAGAQWRVDSLPWRNSGEVQSGVSLGSHTVAFKSITGWDAPASQQVQVYNQQTTQTSGTYVQQTGSLKVNIEPAAARTAGAQWRVDGGAWHNSGYEQSGVGVGSHTVEYSEVGGWVRPDNDFVEIYRDQQTIISGTYTLPASNLIISEFMASNSGTILDDDGDASDWIEIYNPTGSSVNLSGWYLTDKADNLTKWAFPNISIGAGQYLLVFASGKNVNRQTGGTWYYHTNFSLDADGEYLALVHMVGGTPVVVHDYATYEFAAGEFGYPPQERDVSYGIFDGLERYFSPATPNGTNTNSYAGAVSDTKFSDDRGFYYNEFYLTITSDTPGAQVYYTLNGSEPTQSSTSYSGPIHITTTTCVRARAYLAGWMPTNVDTQTYIFLNDVLEQPSDPPGFPSVWHSEYYYWDYFQERWVDTVDDIPADYGMHESIVAAHSDTLIDDLQSAPTLSIVMDTDDLFNPSSEPYVGGIYSNSMRPYPKIRGNESVSEDPLGWERAASVEYIGGDGAENWQVDCGIRLQGQVTRFPNTRKHSLRLLFKSKYGASKLEYPLIPGAGAERFDTIALRSCSSETTMTRDEWGRRAQNIMAPPSAVGTYVHVYINGLYWGVYIACERPDDSFSAEYLGGNKEDWDVIKRDYRVPGGQTVKGEVTTWNQVLSMADGGLSDMTSYNNFKAKMDVENLVNHMLMEYYAGNNDWPGNNWIVARRRVDDNGDPWAGAGFKVYSWDVEAGMLYYEDVYIDKTQTDDATGSVWSCHAPVDWRASYNQEYCMLWADTIHKHMFNGGLLTEDKAAELFLDICSELERPIAGNAARWGTPSSRAAWEADRDRILNDWFFAQPKTRREVLLDQLRARGPADSSYKIYPDTEAPEFRINGSYKHGGRISSSDVLTMYAPAGTIYYTLDGSDPRLVGGAVSGSAQSYSGGITLNKSRVVKARVRISSSNWSALNEAGYSVGPVAENLRITEIMYNPCDDLPGEPNEEFIELKNTGGAAINLNLVRFTKGVDYTFGDVTLGAGDYIVVVQDRTAFAARYNTAGMNIAAGAWEGKLADDGERIRLKDAAGLDILDFSYNDTRDWPLAADNGGHSLVVLNSAIAGEPNSLDWGGNWRASAYMGGSPDVADPAPVVNVVVNEVMAHTDLSDPSYPAYDSNDWIELYNTTGSTINLGDGDWYLSDDIDEPNKWQISGGITISGHGYVVLDEIHHFHSPITEGFGLDKVGEAVILSYLPGTTSDRIADTVRFKGQENGVSLARYPNGGAYWFAAVPSPGSGNTGIYAGVVISEIMYHSGDTNKVEYVELYNPTGSPIALSTGVDAWRLDGAVSYKFPAGKSIGSGAKIVVVGFDPEDPDTSRLDKFETQYGTGALTPSVDIFGPFRGNLSDGGERLGLEKAQASDNPEAPDDLSWIIVDEVIYGDFDPWPTAADGGGSALGRNSAAAGVSGNDPANWSAVTPSPGS